MAAWTRDSYVVCLWVLRLQRGNERWWGLGGHHSQGTSNKAMQCATCQAKMADCPGHYAHIQLHLPVFHIGYFKATIQLLQNICKVRVHDAVRPRRPCD